MIFTDGYVKIFRAILNNSIWQRPTELRLFLFLILMAVFDSNGCKMGDIIVKRGQFLRSYRKLQNDLRYIENNSPKEYSLATLQRAVRHLEKEKMITTKETELGTLFTVTHYEQYQQALNSGVDSGQCLKGLYKDASLHDTELDTPSALNLTNKDGRKMKLRKGHDTGLDTSAKHLRNNNNKEKKEKKYKVSLSFEDIIFPEELLRVSGFKGAYEDWFNHCKEKSVPLTPTTIKVQITDLLKYHNEGHDIKEIIYTAINKSYRGLFPANNQGYKAKGNFDNDIYKLG